MHNAYNGGFSKCDFVQLCSIWQDFNWHSASRGPSAMVEPIIILPVWAEICTTNTLPNLQDKSASERTESSTARARQYVFKRFFTFYTKFKTTVLIRRFNPKFGIRGSKSWSRIATHVANCDVSFPWCAQSISGTLSVYTSARYFYPICAVFQVLIPQ